MDCIFNKKNEILEYVKELEMIEYSLTEEDKILLDDFFNKSCHIVLTNILDKYNKVISEDKRHINMSKPFFPKKKFKLVTPVVKFPNGYHEHNVLYYLEEKYKTLIDDFGLGDIGISNPKFIPSFSDVEGDLHLTYSDLNTRKNFRDTSFAYALEVDVDIRKKEIEKSKVYQKNDDSRISRSI